MADTTISGLTRQTSATTGLIVPISNGTITTGVPVSAIVTATGSMGTGSFQLPKGTSTQRGNPDSGSLRYNTQINQVEYFNGSLWKAFVETSADTYTIQYIVVAGGGGGGSNFYSGGGGAGGYRSSVQGEQSGGGAPPEVTLTVTPGTNYVVVVGAGGSGSGVWYTNGQNGSNSSLGSVVSIGGGGGGSNGSNTAIGVEGGSGGGGQSGSSIVGGAGTLNQGYQGGSGTNAGGGGGGGAGSQGKSATAASPQSGGDGILSTITGTGRYYAGGGGGSMNANTLYYIGLGGSGVGGNGAADYLGARVQATSGQINTGSGGGGACYYESNISGNGSSGIVIIRYPGAPRSNSGVVTEVGGYTIHTFNSSSIFSA